MKIFKVFIVICGERFELQLDRRASISPRCCFCTGRSLSSMMKSAFFNPGIPLAISEIIYFIVSRPQHDRFKTGPSLSEDIFISSSQPPCSFGSHVFFDMPTAEGSEITTETDGYHHSLNALAQMDTTVVVPPCFKSTTTLGGKYSVKFSFFARTLTTSVPSVTYPIISNVRQRRTRFQSWGYHRRIHAMLSKGFQGVKRLYGQF